MALTQNLQVLIIDGSELLQIESVQESGLNEASHYVFVLDLYKYGTEAQPRKKQKVVCQNWGNLRTLNLSNLSLKNSKILSTLSGLRELHLHDVQLLDGEALCLESCINMETLTIRGGNVHTISGIGHATFKLLELVSMKNLRYLPDIQEMTTLNWSSTMLKIVGCEKYSTVPIEEIFFGGRKYTRQGEDKISFLLLSFQMFAID